jgi:hypothetical protein
MVASPHPLPDAFWTMLMFAGFFLWVWVAVAIRLDIFHSGDMGLIARGGKMARQAREQEAGAEEASQSYIAF